MTGYCHICKIAYEREHVCPPYASFTADDATYSEAVTFLRRYFKAPYAMTYGEARAILRGVVRAVTARSRQRHKRERCR